MEAFSKDHLRDDVHGQAFEGCIEIDWRVSARQSIKFLAEMLNLALKHGSNSLHSTDGKEWVKDLAPYPVNMWVGQAY